MVFPPGREDTFKYWKPGGKLPKPKPTVKWLGVVLDSRLSFKPHVKHRRSEARKVVSMLKKVNGADKGLPLESAVTAVKTCVLPSLLYGSEVWVIVGPLFPHHPSLRSARW